MVGTEAGPLEAAGKDAAAVVKSMDAKLAAVGIAAEKVKSECKGCPSVSNCLLTGTKSSLSHSFVLMDAIVDDGGSSLTLVLPEGSSCQKAVVPSSPLIRGVA